MNSPRVLVVDHRDSFVFNLVEDLARLGAHSEVVRSSLSLSDLHERILSFAPQLVVLSPGPGAPQDAGVMVPFLSLRPRIPVLGVCLGMQAMACALGGEVGRAPSPAHARVSRVDCAADPLFEGLGGHFPAGRYHSLCVTGLPPELREIAWTTCPAPSKRLVMAIRHEQLPWWGLQFHPESILTPRGTSLLSNLLRSLPS